MGLHGMGYGDLSLHQQRSHASSLHHVFPSIIKGLDCHANEYNLKNLLT